MPADLSQALKYLASQGVEIEALFKQDSFTVDNASLTLCEFCRYVRDASVEAIWIPLEDPCYNEYRQSLPKGLFFSKAVPVTRIISLAVKLNRKINGGMTILRDLLPLAVNSASATASKRPSLINSKTNPGTASAQSRRTPTLTPFESHIIAAFETAIEYRQLVQECKDKLKFEMNAVEKICANNEELSQEYRSLLEENERLDADHKANEVVKTLKECSALLEKETKEFASLQARNKTIDEKLRRTAETQSTLRKTIAAQQEKIDKAEEKLQKYEGVLNSYPEGLEETYRMLQQDKDNLYVNDHKQAMEALEQNSMISTVVTSASQQLDLVNDELEEAISYERRRVALLNKKKEVEGEIKRLEDVHSEKLKGYTILERDLVADISALEKRKKLMMEQMDKVADRESSLVARQVEIHKRMTELEQQFKSIQQQELEDLKFERNVLDFSKQVEADLNQIQNNIDEYRKAFTEKERTAPWMEQELKDIGLRIKEVLEDKVVEGAMREV